MRNLLSLQSNKVKKFRLTWKLRLFIILFTALLVIAGANALWLKIDGFYDKYYFKRNRMVEIILKQPIEIKEREIETKQIVEIIETIPNPEDLKSDAEKKIYKVFGIENYRVAIAIAHAESNLNCNAVGINVNSADLGLFQINTLWLKSYSLEELANCDRNIEVAYDIWDRGDGKTGNNKGSWNPWTTAKNGAMLRFLE